MASCVVVLKTAEGGLQVYDLLCCHSAADCLGYTSVVTYCVVIVLQTAVDVREFYGALRLHGAENKDWK